MTISRLVVAKEHVVGRRYRAVVLDRRTQLVLWRAPITGWTTANRALCEQWIAACGNPPA